MITGGIKFFEPALKNTDNGVAMEATSSNSLAPFALDKNISTRWVGTTTNDATQEIYMVTFSNKIVSRIIIRGHNLKNFNVKIRTTIAGPWVDVPVGVTAMNGTQMLSGIAETAFSGTTAYYELNTPLLLNGIQINMWATQTPHAQKYISQLIVTTEIGTLKGFPGVKLTTDRSSRNKETLSGLVSVVKSDQVFSCTLNFQNYPSKGYSEDIDLIWTLFDREDPFLIWLCGGRVGSPYFNYTLRGFRAEDIYHVQMLNAISPQYHSNIYTCPVNLEASFSEHI